MKLGVNILNFGPGGSPESLLGWARFAEQTGFSIAMMSDRGPLTPDVQALYPAPFYDPFVTLAWLAGQTEHIELGTTVALLPYRHPLLTARMAANIDRFSGGRFVFGVGVGWSEPEFAALGVPFGQRGAITDEYLAAITELWAGEVVSMNGRFVSFGEVATGPRPARRPRPPIWVGGSSAAGIRRAARFGDAWHPIDPRLDWLREVGLPRLRSAAAEAGRAAGAVPADQPAHRAGRPRPGPAPDGGGQPGAGAAGPGRARRPGRGVRRARHLSWPARGLPPRRRGLAHARSRSRPQPAGRLASGLSVFARRDAGTDT